MNSMQIEGMIDRICGLFPSSQVSLSKAKSAWANDDFLLYQSVEDARKVIPIIMEDYDKFPSLKQVHTAFKQLRRINEPAAVFHKCDICDGNGWDNGERWNFLDKILLDEGYTETHLGQQYKVVKKCVCRFR
jgi:hypothetical protein